MPDTRTPGQICYEAYCESRDPWAYTAFRLLTPAGKRHWEAAAQAVLAQCTPPQEDTP